MTWRASFEPIIRRTLEEVRGADPKVIRKTIIEAYPLHERKYWPYKVWCDEVRRQRGLKTSKSLKTAAEFGQASLPLFEETM